jgi:hypothetical protein
MRTLLVSLLGAAALAGCGGGGDETSDPTTLSDGPLVTYERGGGIAATYTKLTVAEDGGVELSSGFPGQHQEVSSFDLSANDLAGLRDAIAAAAPLELEPTQTGCADCFEYAIEAGGAKVSFDDVDVDEGNISDGIRDLRDRLQAIVEVPDAPVAQSSG